MPGRAPISTEVVFLVAFAANEPTTEQAFGKRLRSLGFVFALMSQSLYFGLRLLRWWMLRWGSDLTPEDWLRFASGEGWVSVDADESAPFEPRREWKPPQWYLSERGRDLVRQVLNPA